MNLDNFFSMNMPAAITVAAALISVLGAIGSAVLAYMGNSALEKRKSELTTQIEAFKAGLADDLAARNARRDYEYDARKRLYAQVEPLLFQLFEAAETAFNAVASLARTQRDRNLPGWLSPGGGE
jgi:phage tail tape-measure protein